MPTITIEFEVDNAPEIVRHHKGRFAGFVAKYFMSRQKLKQKVEETICAEVVKGLEENVAQKLAEQGVRARLVVKGEC